MLNIDLHSHSRVSDGVLSPSELVLRAHANGVKMLALTDHDEVAGVAEARKTACEFGIDLVSGVEVSITWAGTSIHIVGLHVDENDPVLIERLFQNRTGRMDRAKRMGERFEKGKGWHKGVAGRGAFFAGTGSFRLLRSRSFWASAGFLPQRLRVGSAR